jgi:hypothetical protein
VRAAHGSDTSTWRTLSHHPSRIFQCDCSDSAIQATIQSRPQRLFSESQCAVGVSDSEPSVRRNTEWSSKRRAAAAAASTGCLMLLAETKPEPSFDSCRVPEDKAIVYVAEQLRLKLNNYRIPNLES